MAAQVIPLETTAVEPTGAIIDQVVIQTAIVDGSLVTTAHISLLAVAEDRGRVSRSGQHASVVIGNIDDVDGDIKGVEAGLQQVRAGLETVAAAINAARKVL